MLDEDGYLRIVDRKKELIITAGGKNVSPANLEAVEDDPARGSGLRHRRPATVRGRAVVLDPDTAPAWAAQHGITDRRLESLADNPEVLAEIDKGLTEVMAPFNNVERVKKVRVLGNGGYPTRRR